MSQLTILCCIIAWGLGLDAIHDLWCRRRTAGENP